MYRQHFGLKKPPFKITPDPTMFFPGANRGAVLDALRYAITHGEGIIKVVGEVGSGKTMLCRMLEQELPVNCEAVYIGNPNLDPDEILAAVAHELGIETPRITTKLEITKRLNEYLLQKHAAGQRIVLFIEEAQTMSLATLEEIRMLSNLETTQEKLLQIVLFGQPELDAKLARHEIRQLHERITHHFELVPLTRQEIEHYLVARLRAAGFRGNRLFSASAVGVMTRASRGLLRRINILADKALLAAYAERVRVVKPRHVRKAARDSAYTVPPIWRRFALGSALMTVLAVAVWNQWPHLDDQENYRAGNAQEPPTEAVAHETSTRYADLADAWHSLEQPLPTLAGHPATLTTDDFNALFESPQRAAKQHP